MKLREALEHEICSMEFNTYLLDKTNLEVEDILIGILFKNNHTHIVQPTNPSAKVRIFKDINFWLDRSK